MPFLWCEPPDDPFPGAAPDPWLDPSPQAPPGAPALRLLGAVVAYPVALVVWVHALGLRAAATASAGVGRMAPAGTRDRATDAVLGRAA